MSDAAPRLYLVTPVFDDARVFAPRLREALEAVDLASLLVRSGAQGATAIRELAAPAQDKGVAVLVEGSPQLAVEAGADGVQVQGAGEVLREALKLLAPGRIVGAAGLRERHDAMVAGEAGADYVLFGDLGETLAAKVERVGWWAELFNTPCVALIGALNEAAPLAKAGADFLMVGDCVWSDPRGIGAALDDLRRLCAEYEA